MIKYLFKTSSAVKIYTKNVLKFSKIRFEHFFKDSRDICSNLISVTFMQNLEYLLLPQRKKYLGNGKRISFLLKKSFPNGKMSAYIIVTVIGTLEINGFSPNLLSKLIVCIFLKTQKIKI